jgi:hypothetical protein
MRSGDETMRMPEVEKLHAAAIENLKRMNGGQTREGFAALVDAARFLAVAEVCAAIRKDLREIGEHK